MILDDTAPVLGREGIASEQEVDGMVTMVGEINNFVLWTGRPEPWKLEAFPTRENPLGRFSFVVEAELFRQTPSYLV